jgi:hypothetical protein
VKRYKRDIFINRSEIPKIARLPQELSPGDVALPLRPGAAINGVFDSTFKGRILHGRAIIFAAPACHRAISPIV